PRPSSGTSATAAATATQSVQGRRAAGALGRALGEPGGADILRVDGPVGGGGMLLGLRVHSTIPSRAAKGPVESVTPVGVTSGGVESGAVLAPPSALLRGAERRAGPSCARRTRAASRRETSTLSAARRKSRRPRASCSASAGRFLASNATLA